MNRRYLLKALVAVPVAAIAAPIAKALTVKPNRLADGGIAPDVLSLVGDHRCELPISVKPVPSTTVGTLTIEVHCDTSALETHLEKVKAVIQRSIEQNRIHLR
jgi:hypothetical protein